MSRTPSNLSEDQKQLLNDSLYILQAQQEQGQAFSRQIRARNLLEGLVFTLDTTVLKDETNARKLTPSDKGCLEKLIADAKGYPENADSESSDQLESYRNSIKTMADVILKRLLSQLEEDAQKELRAKWEDSDVSIVDLGRGEIVRDA